MLSALKITLKSNWDEFTIAMQKNLVKYAKEVHFEISSLKLWAAEALKSFALYKA